MENQYEKFTPYNGPWISIKDELPKVPMACWIKK